MVLVSMAKCYFFLLNWFDSDISKTWKNVFMLLSRITKNTCISFFHRCYFCAFWAICHDWLTWLAWDFGENTYKQVAWIDSEYQTKPKKLTDNKLLLDVLFFLKSGYSLQAHKVGQSFLGQGSTNNDSIMDKLLWWSSHPYSLIKTRPSNEVFRVVFINIILKRFHFIAGHFNDDNTFYSWEKCF